MLAWGAAAALAAAVPAVAVVANARAAQNSAGCSDDFLIGSRGSGQLPPERDEYQGLGPEVFQFSQRLAVDFKRIGQSYRYAANPYPAVAVSPGGNSDGWLFNLAGVVTGLPVGSFDKSVSQGVTRLVADVRSQIASCPDSHILLAGFSQGAQVTGDAYQQLTGAERRHVLGVFVLADPRRNAADLDANYGSARPAEGAAPSKNARPVFGFASPGPVRSYCRSGDAVCEGPFLVSKTGLVVNHDVKNHTSYPTYRTECGTYPEQAADYFAGLAGMTAGTAKPAVSLTAPGSVVAGEQVIISAGNSCDPSGAPLTFHWKVDGRPALGQGPEVATAFYLPGEHTVQVTVSTGQGPTATATARVTVAPAGAYWSTPVAPGQVASTPGAGSATLTWNPPAWGPPAEGYLVYTTSGDPVGETGPDQPRSITIHATELPLRVVVQSVNRVGYGGTSAPVTMTAR